MIKLLGRLILVTGLVSGLMLLVSMVLVGTDVQHVRATFSQADNCSFGAITTTINPEAGNKISDTLPGANSGRNVYFDNLSSAGLITISSLITDITSSCFVWASPAFTVTTQSVSTTMAISPTVEITYVVNSDYVTGATRVLITTSQNVTGSTMTPNQVITLTFIRDVTEPLASLTLPQQSGQLTFTVSWDAVDDASGVKDFSVAYRREDDLSWNSWLTDVVTQSEIFNAPELGYTYTFSLTARDYLEHRGSDSAQIDVSPILSHLPIIMKSYPLSWKLANGSSSLQFRGPSVCSDGTWYAGTSGTNGVWKASSVDATWSKISTLQPDARDTLANPDDCNETFATVWGGGVYRINASGDTAINSGLGELFLYALASSDMQLFAGTSSRGVYRATNSSDSITWQSVNTGITEQRIRSLYAGENAIYAGARACMLYTSINLGASWSGETIINSGCDDAQVWSIVKVKSTLYAGLGLGKGLYWRPDPGGDWQRVPDIPLNNVYGLAYDTMHDFLYVSTLGSGVYRCVLQQSDGAIISCSTHNTGLSTLLMREMAIGDTALVVTSDSGIWYLPLLP